MLRRSFLQSWMLMPPALQHATQECDAVSVRDYGAVGRDGVDDTDALQRAIDDGHSVLLVPAGIYCYHRLTGLDRDNFTIMGAGAANTVLKFIGNGDALVLGTPAAFKQGINLSGFTVEGNEHTDAIIKARAIARSQWTDINVREANEERGIGFVLQGCMLNRFESLMCSMDRQPMVHPPHEGLRLEALQPHGSCTNNTFTNTYLEGAGNVPRTIEVGLRIAGGDQNVFVGGSPESCGTYGLLVAPGSRFNTFIGVGMENLAAEGGDCADSGTSSRFLNCYSSEKMILRGRGAEISGGYFERIQIDAEGIKNRVKDVTMNYWASGGGGFFDQGRATEWSNIYDAQASCYVYPLRHRKAISVIASPFRYLNDTGQYIEIVVEDGTVTRVMQHRGNDSWLKPFASPTVHLLAPNDELEIAYLSAPSMSYVAHNGFQG